MNELEAAARRIGTGWIGGRPMTIEEARQISDALSAARIRAYIAGYADGRAEATFGYSNEKVAELAVGYSRVVEREGVTE